MHRFSLVVLAACSSTLPTPRTPSHPVEEPKPIPKPVSGNVAPPTPDVHDDADTTADDSDAMEGRLEHAEVLGQGLEVTVSWWTMTGTTHVADELVIKTSRGALHLKSSDDDSGEVLPLIDEIYNAGKQRWVVIGWSSYGEGMQTEHAWLIDGSSQPHVVDKLEWTTDRRHAGLAIDPSGKLRIGIPLPVQPKSNDDEGDHGLHNEGDWQLVHGKQVFTLAQLAKLRAEENHLMAVHAYAPPFQAPLSERDWSGRFIWFSVDRLFARH
ncbi:MAG TPA: hypothetical protein VIV40_11120 [Kofleriaceae bacterium]